MAYRKQWRWEWAGTAVAADVPVWMRPGHGHDGALHSAVTFLVTMRQSMGSVNRDWAFRPIWEVVEHLGDRLPPEGVPALLKELEHHGVVEARRGDPELWRATPLAVEAIDAAYATRHPMTED